MNIILLGPPASGKGTQAELISKKYKLFLMQSGNLARLLSKKDKRIKNIISSGKLIPEEEMSLYVINYLDTEKGNLTDILFEGFPRFVDQYEALEKFLKNKGDDVDAVISLDISKNAAVKRISSRRICEKCGEIYNLLTKPPKTGSVCDECGGKLIQRDDDKPRAIEIRFDVYHENTKKLIDYIDRKKKLIRVDAEKPVEEVFEEIVRMLKNVKR